MIKKEKRDQLIFENLLGKSKEQKSKIPEKKIKNIKEILDVLEERVNCISPRLDQLNYSSMSYMAIPAITNFAKDLVAALLFLKNNCSKKYQKKAMGLFYQITALYLVFCQYNKISEINRDKLIENLQETTTQKINRTEVVVSAFCKEN